jgi:hypothetical protein
MDSPLEEFIEWYLSLPVPHRQTIVEFVIFYNIGFDDIDTTNIEELHNAFVKKLSKYSHDKLKGTAFLALGVCSRALDRRKVIVIFQLDFLSFRKDRRVYPESTEFHEVSYKEGTVCDYT